MGTIMEAKELHSGAFETQQSVARSTIALLSSGESKGESLGSGGSFFLFLRVMTTTGKQFAQRTEFSLMFSHYLSISREFLSDTTQGAWRLITPLLH